GLALGGRELARRQPALGDRLRRRSDRLPFLRAGLQIFFRERAHALHRRLRRRLAAAMRQLDSDRGALSLHEGDQRLEAFGLRLVPDAEVVLVDQADLLDPGRLDEDEAEPAERVTAEMYDMEGAAGVARLGAVMHHRRHDEAVLQGESADGEGLEKFR